MPIILQATIAGEKVDAVFLAILALCAAFLIVLTALMIFFVIRYSRKRNPKAKDIEGNAWLEVAWTVTPLVLFLGVFYYGWTNFEYIRNAPRDAMEVKVTGRQWEWGFEYPNGKQTTELYLAFNRPVKLLIYSADVIHGFYVPAFRIKMDAVAGKENHTWFVPTRLGSFDIECTVICGTRHSYMLSKAVVVPEEEFRAWLLGPEGTPPPGKGLVAEALKPAADEPPAVTILRAKTCLTCHSIDGKVMVGPTFKGIFGNRQTVRAGGKEIEVTVDEAYLKKAIQDPQAEILKGYPPTMPPTALSDAELEEVVGYIKGLK